MSVATVEKRLWCGLGKIYTLRNAPVSVAAADASVVILGKRSDITAAISRR